MRLYKSKSDIIKKGTIRIINIFLWTPTPCSDGYIHWLEKAEVKETYYPIGDSYSGWWGWVRDIWNLPKVKTNGKLL